MPSPELRLLRSETGKQQGVTPAKLEHIVGPGKDSLTEASGRWRKNRELDETM